MELVVSHRADGRTILTVAGEIDFDVAYQLRDAGVAALSGASAGLSIDLSQVTFIDSSGLSALIAINNALDPATQQLALVAPPGSVRRILRMTGLDRAFPIVD